MAKITDLLKERASIRNYQTRQVPEPVLADILEAGRLSPSGGNEQPWKFGVITEPNLIARVAELSHHQDWIARAPLLIVLCTALVVDAHGARVIQKDRFPALSDSINALDPEIYQALNLEEHQTKIAGEHMVLAALEHGIGCCWVSRFDVYALAGLLELPRNILPSEILVLGYPARSPKQSQKKPLEEIVFFNHWTAP